MRSRTPARLASNGDSATQGGQISFQTSLRSQSDPEPHPGNTIAAVIAEKSPARAPAMKFVIKDSPCFIGLNKDEPALLAKVNEIVAKAKASGELGKISEKWLKAALPAGF